MCNLIDELDYGANDAVISDGSPMPEMDVGTCVSFIDLNVKL